MLPPLDPHELGEVMFSQLCTELRWMQLVPEGVKLLIERYQAVLEKGYLSSTINQTDDEPSVESGDPSQGASYALRIRAAGVSSAGETTLLVTIEDQETGNFILPRRLQIESELAYSLAGGSPQFQGLLLTVGKAEPRADGKVALQFRERFLVPNFSTLTELARISEADWRSPFSNLVDKFLAAFNDSLDHVQSIRTAECVHSSPLMGQYLLRTTQGFYLLGLGDPLGRGFVDIQYGFRCAEPECGSPPSGSKGVGPSERIVSVVQELAHFDGDILLDTDRSKAAYHLERVRELIQDQLFDRSNGIWDTSWVVALHAPRISPEGSLRCVVSLEDGEGRFHVPWLGLAEVDRGVVSDSFVGIAVEVQFPEGVLTNTKSPPTPNHAPGSQVILHAYLTRNAMNLEIRRLAHRAPEAPESVREVASAHDPKGAYSGRPSEYAVKGVFYPELESVVCEDLIEQGMLTPPQARAVGLRNIRVAMEKGVDVGEALNVDFYLVLAEHQWGTHVVKFQRVNELGGVPFTGAGSVFAFFPKSLYRSAPDEELFDD
jgi:hypothetical protein